MEFNGYPIMLELLLVVTFITQKSRYLDLNLDPRLLVPTRSLCPAPVIFFMLGKMRSEFMSFQLCATFLHFDRYVLRSQLLPHSFALNDYVLALAISADEKVVASGGTKLCMFRVDTGEALRSFDWTGRCTLRDTFFPVASHILQMYYLRGIESHCARAVQRRK